MNTTTILLACLGLAFANVEAEGDGQQAAAAAGKQSTDAAWKRLLREEGFLWA